MWGMYLLYIYYWQGRGYLRGNLACRHLVLGVLWGKGKSKPKNHQSIKPSHTTGSVALGGYASVTVVIGSRQMNIVRPYVIK